MTDERTHKAAGNPVRAGAVRAGVVEAAEALGAAFLAGLPCGVPWGTPAGGRGWCVVASGLFAAFAAGRGWPVEMWQIEGAWPERDPDADFVHCVARLDGCLVVDFTARQFDPAAPYPLVEARGMPWPAGWDGRVTRAAPVAVPWAELAGLFAESCREPAADWDAVWHTVWHTVRDVVEGAPAAG